MNVKETSRYQDSCKDYQRALECVEKENPKLIVDYEENRQKIQKNDKRYKSVVLLLDTVLVVEGVATWLGFLSQEVGFVYVMLLVLAMTALIAGIAYIVHDRKESKLFQISKNIKKQEQELLTRCIGNCF